MKTRNMLTSAAIKDRSMFPIASCSWKEHLPRCFSFLRRYRACSRIVKPIARKDEITRSHRLCCILSAMARIHTQIIFIGRIDPDRKS